MAERCAMRMKDVRRVEYERGTEVRKARRISFDAMSDSPESAKDVTRRAAAATEDIIDLAGESMDENEDRDISCEPFDDEEVVCITPTTQRNKTMREKEEKDGTGTGSSIDYLSGTNVQVGHVKDVYIYILLEKRRWEG